MNAFTTATSTPDFSMDAFREAMRLLPKPLPRLRFMMHPATYERLKCSERGNVLLDAIASARAEVQLSVHMDQFQKRTVFPNHRFVEYEPKDARWMIPLGMAYKVDTDEPLIYQIDDSMFDRSFLWPSLLADGWKARTL